MHIVHLINTFPLTHKRAGGAEYECARICEKLALRGHKITVMTTKFDRDFSQKNLNYQLGWLRGIENFIGYFSRYTEILKWYICQFDPITFISAYKFFKKTKPDIVHLHNVYILTFAPLLAARLLKIPVLLSIYDYWPFCLNCVLYDYNRKSICRRFHGIHCVDCAPPKFKIFQKLLLIFRKIFFNYFLDKVNCFIGLSESSRKILEEYGIPKEKIDIVPLTLPDEFGKGMNNIYTSSDVNNDDKIVLYIGWLQRRKGIHILLEAMDIVWKEIPSAKLYIKAQRVKWEKDYEEKILAKINSFPKDKVKFIEGHIPRDEIRDYIQKSSVVVISEQWENMSPLLMMEAMYLAKPIVAGNIGGIPEFIDNEKEGLLAIYDNPEDYANKIIRILKDKQLALRLGQNASERVKSYTIKSDSISKLEKIYYRLASNKY